MREIAFELVADLVKHELVDLAAGLAPVAAQPLDDPRQRILFHDEAVRLGRALDQPLEVLFGIGVTRQCRQRVLGLGQRAQAGARREIAAFEHDERIAGTCRDEVLEGRRRLLSGRPHADHAPSAHQGHRRELVGQARRIALQRVAADIDDAERILEVLAHGARELYGPLGDQAVVVAVDDDAADPGIRLLQEGVDVARLDLHAAFISRR